MNNIFYIATSGMKVGQNQINDIANNIANINTTGYKRLETSFMELMQTQVMQARTQDGKPDANKEVVRTGSGVSTAQQLKDYSVGNVINSGRNLDVMLNKEGFFALQDSTGEIKYTRDGQFNWSAEGDRFYLTSSNGEYVLDSNKDPIYFLDDANETLIDINGRIFHGTTDTNQVLGRFSFNMPQELRFSDNGYYETDSSGTGEYDEDCDVTQGSYEMSNANLAQEMSSIMQGQRAYQMSANMLQWSDEIESMTINMKRY